MKKRVMSIIVVLTMIVSLLPAKTYAMAISNSVPSISVNVLKKIDVALAAGITDVDYSSFAEDLKEELLRQGNVPAEDINISQLQASEVSTSSNSSFEWWTYDHSTSANIFESDHKFIELLSSNNNNGHPYYSLDRHIEVSNGGADLTFKGYGSSGYKDFMYLENSDPTKKTFDFDIEEGVAYDALDGVGFLFNTSISGSYVDGTQTMNGYLLFFQYGYNGKGQEISLYKLTNVNSKSLHQGSIPTIGSGQGLTKLASAPYSATDKYRKIRVQVQPTKVKVWYEGSPEVIEDSLTDSDLVTWSYGTEKISELTIDKTGSYGFGPLGSYRAHGCSLPTVISLKNLKMTTEKAKSLTEVVREPEWHSGTIKYIVNANSEHIDDFDDIETTAEIINRLNNDDVYYFGWGSNENEEQTKEFLALNDLKGDVINTDKDGYSTYELQIKAIASGILKRYSEEKSGETAYVLTSDNVKLTVSNADAINTLDAGWPQGKWKVVHSTEGFNNADEVYAYSGQYMSNLDIEFSLPGTYQIYYEDSLVRTIVAHRKPVASFVSTVVTGSAITVDNSNENQSEALETNEIVEEGTNVVSNTETTAASGAAIVYKNLSYDLDSDDSIDQTKTVWKYINLSDENPVWITTTTPPTSIQEDGRYLVSLIVTDEYGEVSLPYTRQISYSADEVQNQVPFADFELSTSTMIKGTSNQSVTITDKSYDFYNADLTYDFSITKDGQSYDKALQFGTNDLSEEGVGIYRISLIVHSINGNSVKVTRVLNVVEDNILPTALCNVENNTTTGYNQVVLTYDDLGGSGFKGQQYIITGSEKVPADNEYGWSNLSKSKTRYVTFEDDGTYYIHYKAFDESGNTITGYYGPFKYEANIPYVKEAVSPTNLQTDVNVNASISFKMSENVVKGDGYLTIYNAETNQKYIDIHSSNRRVKIDNTSKMVVIELNGLLSHNTKYYVEIGNDFLRDNDAKSMAKMSGKDTWTFETVASDKVNVEDEIEILTCTAEQTIDDVVSYPWVSVDGKENNTFLVYASAGTFTLAPVFSAATEGITVKGTNCNATLSSDEKSIAVNLEEDSENPFITVTVGNNVFTFKIVKSNKKTNTQIQIETNNITASVDYSNLLNAVDISDDLNNSGIEKIDVKLLIREPQITSEKEELEDYLKTSATASDKYLLFDASLYKTIYDGTNSIESNIKNTQEAISILLEIPSKYQKSYSYQLYRNHDGVIEEIESKVIDSGTKLSFKTDRFSTYAIVYTLNAASSDSSIVQEEIKVPTSISLVTGETDRVSIKNLPKDAKVSYHVCSPTIITVSEDGTLFAKKLGNGVLFATIKDSDCTTTYMIKIKITGSNLPTKVGYIPYSDKIITYKNINYRITRTATDSYLGTVSVANNQVNSKLPKEVVIPRNIKINGVSYLVTSIDESAFYDVKTVKKVTIPNSVSDISSTAFVGCKNLKSFTVSKTNTSFISKNGILLNKEGNKLIAYPSATGKVTIDSKITVIGDYAFSVTRGLTSVTIPATVKEIGACAFSHSKSLVTINFKGTEVPSISVVCIFDAINAKAVINVPKVSIDEYQKALKNALQPATVTIVGVIK